MTILKSCLLELREYKIGRVLCRIMLNSIITDGQYTEPKDLHWLNKSHWSKFDDRIDQFTNELFDKKRENSFLVDLSFQINDEIDVKVTNSTASVKTLLQFLDYATLKKTESVLALDCLISCSPKIREDSQPTIASDFTLSSSDYSENLMSSLNTSISDIGIANENQCSSKFLKTTDKNIFSDSSDDFNVTKLTRSDKIHKVSPEMISNSPQRDFTPGHKTRSRHNKIKACQDDNVDLHKYVVKKSERIMEKELKSFESEKSDSKQKMLSIFAYSSDKKSIIRKGSIHKPNFTPSDSEAESDDIGEKTPVKTKNSEHRLMSLIKKRKNDEPSCKEPKQSVSKWLSKKQPDELDLAKSKSRENLNKKTTTSNSLRTTKRIVYPTSEEKAEKEYREIEQMKANKRIKSILEDLIQVPKEVNILSLNNMTAEEILNTYPKYKNQLDDIFHELKSKPKVTGYNGINHYLVIELIDNEKQLQMMNKLGEIYEKDPDGVSLNPTLFANAMMPEWLVNIFKDKYKFSYKEAVSHLHEQRQYMQYMDVDHQSHY